MGSARPVVIANSEARVDDYLFTHAHHHAVCCNILKPPCMSAVVQGGGTLNFSCLNFPLSPPQPLFVVVHTCKIIQLCNTTTLNPLPAAGPWQDAVLPIQLMYESVILCLLVCA